MTTPKRGFRVDDELWGAAQARAVSEGLDLSTVLRALLQSYVDEELDITVEVTP